MDRILHWLKKDQYKHTFFFAWAIIGLVQACFTQLMDDEAYYWVYSQHLAWGYFDHPPMIAVLIKAGYSLFHNELGVRLFMVLLNVGTLVLLDRLIPVKNNKVLYLVLGGMGAMQLGGMLAVPDLPLIFFGTLYFVAYKKFLEAQDWKQTIFLALSMALMFYSKYHGILLVFFTLISNLSLLKVRRYYIAVVITTILFLPHLIWQYQHDFPSLQYHLVERNAAHYRISFTLDYLLGQILLFGPLVGWLLLYYGIRCTLQSAFERALKFSLVGVLVFFMISTFKGRVEANWTVMVFTPLVILAHQAITRMNFSIKPLLYTLPVSLLLVLIVRVYMVWDFVPGLKVRPEIHHNHEWTEAIARKAGDKPVVFYNSYQLPSKYMFYTGKLAYSLNNVFSRRSQYNYWETEPALWGKEVLVADKSKVWVQATDSMTFRINKHLYFMTVKPYYSYNLIQFNSPVKKYEATVGQTVQLKLGVSSNYNIPVQLNEEAPAVIAYGFWDNEGWNKLQETDITLPMVVQKDSVMVPVKVPDNPGLYKMKMSILVKGLQPTHNSQTMVFEVRP